MAGKKKCINSKQINSQLLNNNYLYIIISQKLEIKLDYELEIEIYSRVFCFP